MSSGVNASVNGGASWGSHLHIDGNTRFYQVGASGTVKIHVNDAAGQFGDNSGSSGWAVFEATVTGVGFRGALRNVCAS
jgi:hypothetical protein